MNNLIALGLVVILFAPSAAMAHGGDEHESSPILAEPSTGTEHTADADDMKDTHGEALASAEEIKANGMRLAHEAVVSLKYKATFAVVIILILMALLAHKYPPLRRA